MKKIKKIIILFSLIFISMLSSCKSERYSDLEKIDYSLNEFVSDKTVINNDYSYKYLNDTITIYTNDKGYSYDIKYKRFTDSNSHSRLVTIKNDIYFVVNSSKIELIKFDTLNKNYSIEKTYDYTYKDSFLIKNILDEVFIVEYEKNDKYNYNYYALDNKLNPIYKHEYTTNESCDKMFDIDGLHLYFDDKKNLSYEHKGYGLDYHAYYDTEKSFEVIMTNNYILDIGGYSKAYSKVDILNKLVYYVITLKNESYVLVLNLENGYFSKAKLDIDIKDIDFINYKLIIISDKTYQFDIEVL